jgi:outer membrane protein assembly factor BamB
MDGTLRAYDRTSGVQQWTTRLGDTVVAPPLVSGEQFIGASASGLLKAVGVDGKQVWTASVEGVGAPMTALPGGGVLVQDSEKELHAFDPIGAEIWATALPEAISGEGAALDRIAALPDQTGIIGIHLEDGSTAWRRQMLQPVTISPDGLIAAEHSTARITADGELIGALDPDADYRESTHAVWPLRVGDQYLMMDASGTITAPAHE